MQAYIDEAIVFDQKTGLYVLTAAVVTPEDLDSAPRSSQRAAGPCSSLSLAR
jgi:hypothetical protein